MRIEPTFGFLRTTRPPAEMPDNRGPGTSLVPARQAGRDLVAPEAAAIEKAEAENRALPPSRGGFTNIRKMSPRQMADLAMKLHSQDVLSYQEYSMLAYQPELDPRYDETIGALTGEEADPDRPRDFLQDWEDRLNFERRYGAENSEEVQRTEKVLAVLNRFDRPVFLST